MNDDQIDGNFSEAKGKVKDAVGGLTGDAKTQGEGKVDQLTGQAQQAYGSAKDAVSDVAGNAADTMSDATGRATDTLRDTAETVKSKAGEVGSKVYEAGQTAGQYVGSTIQEQPMLSLIGIAAIGYLVGYLVHSPSSPLNPEPRYRKVIRRWS
ncbi:CsbD family protein [Acidisoma sp.]|uniref:CsbD family protein n=1 Tax=Acidisoma sp. TaxID=1872115 RepID=UPI003B0056C7